VKRDLIEQPVSLGAFGQKLHAFSVDMIPAQAVPIELLAAGELLEVSGGEVGFGTHLRFSFAVVRPRHAASIEEESARGLDGGRARDRRGITRLHKRSAEGGETEPEVADLALERRGARYNDSSEAADSTAK
jgi:hypothetical protein